MSTYNKINNYGAVWDEDVDHVEKMCSQISEMDDLAFIVVAGDMAHALPNDDEGFSETYIGDFPPLRYKLFASIFDKFSSFYALLFKILTIIVR